MKKSNLKLILIFGFILNFNSLFSQDLLLFQYDNLPILLNPALTGNDHEHIRISTNFRNQSRSLLTDVSNNLGFLGIDYRQEINANNYFGLGLIVSGERATSGIQSTFNFKPTFSFNKVISNSEKRKSSISIGSAIGASRLSIADQINLPTPDPNLEFKKWYFDLSFGIDFNYSVLDRIKLNAGINVNHLNKPNISLFTDGINTLQRSINLHTIAEIKFNKSYSLLPSILILTHGPYEVEIYGIKNRFYLNEKKIKYLQLGFQYLPSFGNTLVVNAETRISQVLISISIGRDHSEFSWSQDDVYEIGMNYYLKK